VKRQPTERKEVFASYSSDRGLDPEYMKNSENLPMKKQIIQFKNGPII
jgi:hypothetical protein